MGWEVWGGRWEVGGDTGAGGSIRYSVKVLFGCVIGRFSWQLKNCKANATCKHRGDRVLMQWYLLT